MKNEDKKDILQEQEIVKDLTCKDENKVQNNVHIEKETNDTKNISGLNKKKILAISLSIIAFLIISLSIFIAQIKFNVITNIVHAFKERHRFIIETQDNSIYVGLGEEVTLNTATKLFQSKVENLEIVSNNEEVLSVNDNVVKGEKVGKAILYGKSGERESYPINLECIIKVQDIILEKDKIDVSVGYPLKIKADIYPKNATYKKLEYISSNEQVAIVKDGKIIGINEGECVITIKDKTGNVQKECEIVVKYIPVEDIKLDEESIEIGIGKKYILYGRLYPEFASNTNLEWNSSDENIVHVENGILTAVSEGEAIITIKASEEKTSECKVKVSKNEPDRQRKYARGDKPLRIKPIDNAEEIVDINRNNNVEVLKEYDEWIKIREENGQVGYLPKNECTKEKSYYIKDVPFIDQYELGYPTGCEAVSATMVAKYKGYNIEPFTIINNTPTDERGVWTEIIEVDIEKENDNKEPKENEEKIKENEEQANENDAKIEPKEEEIIQKEKKEVTYASDPFKVFVGHPSKNYEQGSYGCYAPPIIEALEKCYINCTDISGCTESELLKNIEEGNPIVVWGTYDAREVEEKEEWLFPDGQEGSYTHLKGEHCMVLIGYDDDNIYLNDPIAGKDVSQPKDIFFRNWKKLYSQAIRIY